MAHSSIVSCVMFAARARSDTGLTLTEAVHRARVRVRFVTLTPS